MTRRIPLILTFSLLMIVFMASSVFSARKAPPRTQYNPVVRAIYDMALPMEHLTGADLVPREKGELSTGASLGASVPSASPGAAIGNSYYDYQANTYQGRMIRVGTHDDLGDLITLVHSTWMDLQGPDLSNGRGPAYAYYDAFAGFYQNEVNVIFPPEFAGYHNLEITADNQAVIIGHYHPSGNTDAYSPTLWYDAAPGDQGFPNKAIVPDTLINYPGNPYTGDAARTIWPHVAFQERPNGNHVTHVAAVTTATGLSEHALAYYRKEGTGATNLALGGVTNCPGYDPNWDCTWWVDTVQATVAGVEASDKSGKVALFFTNNLPDYTLTPGCDTCSVNTSIGVLRDRYENDMYYHVSDDYGVTWGNMVNVTKNDATTMDWSPWNDMDGLWTGTAGSEEFHIAWSASDWKAYREEGTLYFRSRVYHWAESFGTGADKPRAAMTSRLDPIDCNPGAFNANLSKINLAECNGNIYITAVDLWDGHDDPLNSDCSQRGKGGDFSGAVNGEIVVVISDNNGLSFDLPHNLTQSPTPNCDPTGAILVCQGDHWPSMTPYGHVTNNAHEIWSGVTSVNPRPAQSYPPTTDGLEWLHIQYVNDLDPGFTINDNSTWQNNPIRHFRMACVDPDQIPVISLSITEVNWPNFVKPGQTKNITVIAENTGNAPLNFTVQDFEDTGPSGWLSTSGYTSPLADGFNNLDTGLFILNATGLSSGNVVYGSVLFDSDAPSDTDRVPVVMIVADTISNIKWDTISTGIISLAISNTGQFGGGSAIATNGGARLDYFKTTGPEAECDTVDSIIGSTEVYLYDGAFAVGGIVDTGGGLDTTFSSQIFSQGFRNEWAVYPLGDGEATIVDSPLYVFWKSPKMVNEDSTLGFRVTWYAPKTTAPHFAGGNTRWTDQQFMTRCLKVWQISTNPADTTKGLVVGDVMDWDIPTDSGSDNSGVADATRRLVYCRGAEFDQDTGPGLECQDNDLRYGGSTFSWSAHWHDTDPGPATVRLWTVDSAGWGGYVEANARYVYPGWRADELYVNIESNNAWVSWTHASPDSQVVDLHTAITAKFDFDLGVAETLAVYTSYATVREDVARQARMEELADRGNTFTKYWGCCEGKTGDFNGDGNDGNILDLNYGVNVFFRFTAPVPPCLGEADVNRSGNFNTLDFGLLVNRIFRQNDLTKHCTDG